MLGANGTLSAIVARDTQAQLSDLHFGRGVEIHGMSTPITVNVDSSLVSGNLEGGIIVFAANANIVGTKVGQTSASASDGNLGDAIIPFGGGEVAIAGCMLEDSARAGIGNAGSVVKLGTTRLECNPIQLNAETAGTNDQAGTFQDVGGNLCGCGGTRESCRVMSSHLAPPEALPGPPR
jgi:hypothetical protein